MAPPKPRTLAPDRDLWERQPGEHEHAWACFLTYRDAGEDRTIRASERATGKSHTQTQRWATQWRWAVRANAYDRHLDAARVRATRKNIGAMAERHANLANAALGVLQEPIKELIRRLTLGTLDLKAISDTELLRWVRASALAIKDLTAVERVARGAPDSIRQHQHRFGDADDIVTPSDTPAEDPAVVVMRKLRAMADNIKAERAAKAAAPETPAAA